MATLIIDTGRIELDIKRDGKNVGVFAFNPKDTEEAKKHSEIVEMLEKNQAEQLTKAKEIDENGSKLDAIKFINEFVDDMYNKIDLIYGKDTCKTVFGECKNVDMLISFFRQLQPYYAKASKERKEKYQSNK